MKTHSLLILAFGLGLTPSAPLLAQAPAADDFNPGVISTVYSLALQADEKILVGGDFNSLGGQTRNRIGRLNPDGTLDASFNPGAGSAVTCLALQPDGKILVGGSFTTLGGQTRNRIGRLNPDGTLDASFNPGAGSAVTCLALQPDGKILVGGSFTTLGGQTRNRIGRLNPDGTLDASFNPGASGAVSTFAIQPDGKILVGGSFITLGGQTRNRIGRLNLNGTLDTGFNPGADYEVYCLAVQADGKILVGGHFTSLGGQSRNGIGRLNGDGSLDNTFNPGTENKNGNGGMVKCLVLQADGKILIGGGYLAAVAGLPRNRIARLNADGTVDAGFNPGASRSSSSDATDVNSLALQADGKILVGGYFTTLGGQPRNSIGRLNNTEPATQSLSYEGSTITWLRGGSGPEVWRTTFESSTDGSNWTFLGTGVRIAGGWELAGVALPLPSGGFLRARGNAVPSGRDAWFLETYYGKPILVASAGNRTNFVGTTAVFSVLAGGSQPLSYQWLKDGVPLGDGGNISGALTARLVARNVFAEDEGAYSIVVTNTWGSATSSVAVLTVRSEVNMDTFAVPAGSGIDVKALLVQPDTKILVGGGFSTLGDQTRNCIGRLNADGTVDAGFNPVADATVYSMALQADGKIVVGGGFSTLGGQPRTHLGRLNADGTLDATFNPGVSYYYGSGVYSVILQADGRILVGGKFTSLGGQTRNNIGRLNEDGTLDMAFKSGTTGGAYPDVYALAVQADGKILVGGSFTTLGGQTRNRIGRLNPDGSLDTDFNPGADGVVHSLALQADGRILVGGSFTTLGGQTRNRIGRLNSDGNLDIDFNPGASSDVSSLAVQTDGKILVGGYFTTLGGQTRNRIGRLNADGTLDENCNPEVRDSVPSIALQSDGKILFAGEFKNVGGQWVRGIGRWNNTEPATQQLSYESSTITWLRGGTQAEVWRTTFESSADGITWTLLGDGVRVAGGWQLAGIEPPLPADSILRARGYTAAGYRNASGWFADDYYGRPLLIDVPASRTQDAGTTAVLSVLAGGSETLRYQWLKDGLPLMDGGNLSGVKTPVLTLTHVLGEDVGDYQVVVTNAWGATTSVVATLTVNDPVIVDQPLGRNREQGQSVALGVIAVGTAPFGYQWWKNGEILTGATNPILALDNLQATDAGNYQPVVAGRFGSCTSAVATLTVNVATLDTTFEAESDGSVGTMAVQPDGKILAGGSFTTLGGQPRRGIGRLNSDGSLDSDFNPGEISSASTLAVQPDGKIVVGGDFTPLGGRTSYNIWRLNEDGTLDTGFNPGPDSRVLCLALQADGKILVGGSFTILGGQPRFSIGRLNADGTLDLVFKPYASGAVRSLALQADGKILVGGLFTSLGGQAVNRIGRLNADGTLDTTFNPGADGDVYSLALQSDGKILVGGRFSTLGGQPRSRIGRLNPNGTLDESFNPGASADVNSLALQADGKILVGGSFTTLGGQTRSRIGRLNPDGTLDLIFNPGGSGVTSTLVSALAVQADGKVLVGGGSLVRLDSTEEATQRLAYESSTLTWLRGGASPEVWRVTFESSVDGSTWTLLDEAERIAFGWQLSGVTLPVEGSVRARGYVTGNQNASGWFAEGYYGMPGFIVQPTIRTHDAGNTAILRVVAGSSEPLSYRWFKGGVALLDGGNISGAATPTLTVAEVFGADAGAYHVVVSNAFGSRTSAVADLRVNDPAFAIHPEGLNRELGQSATLSATVIGTPPLNFQWWKDGVAMVGATDSSLTLGNLNASDPGYYTLAVTGPWGSAVSMPAPLTVNLTFVEPTFHPGASGSVSSLVLQTDGKIVVGGDFTTLGGQTRNRIGRLNADGTLDAGLNPGASSTVNSLALQSDGKILVGGSFTTLGGQTRNRIGRLNPDGTLDESFNPGANYAVNCLAAQADGKILVGGEFTTLGGQPRNRIGRLNPNGTPDTTFNPGANYEVYCLAAQADGKILVGGSFTTLGGQARTGIARLNGDGSLDTTFNPGANAEVFGLAVLPDGKILVGGIFTILGGQPRSYIGRLNSDGALDTTFNPGANYEVYCLAAQADGKILVGGFFTILGGQPRSYIGRLNSDGALDTTFNPGANGQVNSLAVQADGKAVVGGSFTSLGGQSRSGIGRLVNPEVGYARILSPIRSGSILAGDTLLLRGASEFWPEGLVTEWHWELGERRTFSAQNPGLVSFPTPGEHTVRLVLKEADGSLRSYADIRQITVAEPVGQLPDLAVSRVVRPSDAAIGTPFELTYEVSNLGDAELTGETWRDAVYLSRDEYLDITDLPLTSTEVSETIPSGSSIARTLTVTIPLVEEGLYSLIVSVDDEWRVLERHQLNNEAALDLDLFIPTIADGGVVGSTLVADGDTRYYRIQLAEAQNLVLRLTAADSQGLIGLYAQHGSPPTLAQFNARATTGGSANQQLLVEAAAPGTWYVMIHGETVTADGSFTLEAGLPAITLTGVTPGSRTWGQPGTLTVTGAGLDASTTLSLIALDGSAYSPTLIELDSYTRLTATFDFATVPPGIYTVRATSGSGQTAVAPGTFKVLHTTTAVGKVGARMVLPSALGRHEPATIFVEYANTGDAPMPAPLIVLESGDPDGSDRPIMTLDRSKVSGGLWTSAMPRGFSDHIQFIASGRSPGLLEPGESGRVPIYYVGLERPWNFKDTRVELRLGSLTSANDVSVDWSDYKDSLRPYYIQADAWDVLWGNFTSQVGNTWGSYQSRLALNAADFARLDYEITDVSMLLAMEFRKADALNPISYLAQGLDAVVPAPGLAISFQRGYQQPISRRFQLGPLGRGWVHNWQFELVGEDDGTVRIMNMTGTPRLFQPDTRLPDQFITVPGDLGKLVHLGGHRYQLTETDGSVSIFDADGRLESVADLWGNQIVCAYTGGRLTSLTHNSAGALAISYNTQGRINTVTDPVGRVTRYDYDGSGEHLTSVTASDGRVTTYRYSSGEGAAREHALVEIDYPGGAQRHYGYDDRGRLEATWRNNQAERVSFGYDSSGRVTMTDANQQKTTFFIDHRAQIVKAETADRQSIHYQIDLQGNLTTVTDNAGRKLSMVPNSRGHTSSATDPMGYTTAFSYQNDRLAGLRDANGSSTRFETDARGGLTTIRYPDGSSEGWTYDDRGNALTWRNRRGQVVSFTYNQAGRLTSKTLPDGTVQKLTYDSLGRLQRIEDSYGTTTYEYDGQERLTRIDYPQNRWLEFTYDTAGRRRSSLDQLGHRLTYDYDTLGRLTSVTDESSVVIAQYAYDAVGQVTRKTLGNGVYTTYDYDASGRITELVNRGPDAAILSRFARTYDARGRVTRMETHYGAWNYGYDENSQLTRATLVSTDPEIPDQDLTYVYDALGNRLRTIENSVTTVYTINALNQYTQVGNRTCEYDADGNLIREAGPDSTTTYEYNVENRLVRVVKEENSTSQVWEYSYNALGQRVRSAENGVESHFVIDPAGLGDVVGVYDAAGVRLAGYDHAGGLIRATDGSATVGFYTADPMGNVAQVTDAVASERNVYIYDPFIGVLRQRASIANPFVGSGQLGVLSEEHGLVQMRARFYDPESGRFGSADPIGVKGGINVYTYARNNPLMFNDPTGLAVNWCGVISGGVQLVSGAVTVTAGIAAVQAASIPLAVAGGFGLLIGSFDVGLGLASTTMSVVGDERALDWNHSMAGVIAQQAGSSPQVVARWDAANAVIAGFPTGGSLFSLLNSGYAALGTQAQSLFCAPFKNPIDSPGPESEDQDTDDTDLPEARDPNQKLGPSGFGEANHVTAGALFPYRIDFENMTNATAPAQQVFVTDPLSPHLDWDTFELTEVGFGDVLIAIPPGTRSFATNLLAEVLGTEIEVQIEAGLNRANGQMNATFRSLDPETGWLPPVEVGLLPPEDGTGRGKGHVSYVIRAKPGLPSGTEIRNVASIQFGFLPVITTNQRDPQNAALGTDPAKEALVTIDAEPPTSAVGALPEYTQETFIVVWSGVDQGSGISSFDIYVSTNAGPWELWLASTVATEAPFTGKVGQSYGFYSVARDHVGLIEDKEPVAEAVTTVRLANRSPVITALGTQQIDEGVPFSLTLEAADPDSDDTLTFTLTGGAAGMGINPSSGVLTWTPTEAQGPGTYAVKATVSDNGEPVLSDTVEFSVEVREVNSAPVLTTVAEQVVDELTTLNLMLTTSDPDIPANTLTYSLTEGPNGMAVDASSGMLTWTPTDAQGPGTYAVAATVRDNGVPSLSDTVEFSVVVRAVAVDPPVIQMPVEWKNGVFEVRVPTISGRTYTLEYKNRLEDLDWRSADQIVGDGTVRTLSDPAPTQGSRFYRIRVG